MGLSRKENEMLMGQFSSLFLPPFSFIRLSPPSKKQANFALISTPKPPPFLQHLPQVDSCAGFPRSEIRERERKKKFFVCLRSIEKAFPESGKTQFAGGKKKKRGNPNQSSSCRVVAVIRVSPGAWVCLQSWEAFICLSFKKIGNKVFYSVCLSETTNNNFVFAFVELFLFLLHRKES